MNKKENRSLFSERNKLLTNIVKLSEVPLFILALLWLGLLIAELTDRSNSGLESLGLVIWVIFIIDFIMKFLIATSKLRFLRRNILTMISLIVPAFRVFRIFRIFRLIRLTRGLRLIKVVGSFNRGMRSLALTLHKRAFVYVVSLSIIVIFLGAAGLFAFEKSVNEGFKTYGSSVWWTAMLVMSMGTENWPKTSEGRFLCIMIALYGLAVFGYITATIATFFIGKDDPEVSKSNNNGFDDIKGELLALREEIKSLKNKAL